MKYLLLIVFSSIITLGFSQSVPDSLEKTASDLYSQGEMYAACKLYKKVAKEYPEYERWGNCLYNVAYIYQEVDSLDQAIEWYNKVLNSNLEDSIRTGGKGIFEPFTNYKYYSCFNLGEISFGKKEYQKALEYYQKAGTIYQYYNTSGTDIQIRRVIRALCISDCQVNLSKTDEALITILPLALDSYKGPKYNWILGFTIDLIEKNFEPSDLKNELDAALSLMKFDEKTRTFSIVFKDHKLELTPYTLNEYTKSNFIIEIKENEFWKRINTGD